ncbi:MAG: S-layer homology domain-containing protein [Oscillospiraceae bacterium]|nr:S-layer homology domain-containing protein [Oscillospiraceae bacterium]
MKKRTLAVMLLVLCMLVSLMPATALAAGDVSFSDVAADAWYAESVQWAVNGDITGGVGDNLFAPDRVTTRAEAMTFLYKAMGSPAEKAESNPFTDVNESDWFYTPVLWAVQAGVTAGVSADKFGVNEPCTREQFVTFLYKAVGAPAVSASKTFVDVSADAWYAQSVQWAVENGVTAGVSADVFGVGNPVTRAQTVTFLYANDMKAALVHNYADLMAAINDTEPKIKLASDFSTEGEETAAVVVKYPVVLDGNFATIDFGFEVVTGGVTIKNFNINTSVWGKAVCKNGKPDADGNMTRGDCIAIEIHNATDVPVIIENNNIVHDVFLNNNSSVYLADGTLAYVLNNNIKTENKSNASFERGGIYIGSGTRGKVIGNTIDSAKTAMPMSPLGLTENLDKMSGPIAMPAIEIKDNTCSSIYVTKMYTNGVLFGEDGYIKFDSTDFGAREALEAFLVALNRNNSFTTKYDQLPADENAYVVSRLDLIYAGTPLKQASNYFEIVGSRLVEKAVDIPEKVETVKNYTELTASIAKKSPAIKLADDFSIEGEETAAIVIDYPVVLDGNNAKIDFGFEVVTGGVTIKNFNINTSVWGKAVCKNGKPDADGNMTRGDCIAIEIHNATNDPVVIENNTIVHDVFLNNNSSVYLADGTLAHVINNKITTENKSNASFERGGIYIGSGTRGKVIGNTIDSAKTAMPMSPLGLTANLDKMTEAIEMPAIEIKDNICSSIYVTKMYTNGVLFGEDGYIKEDDTDFGAREALEQFLAALDANNTFTIKADQLPADENAYVVSRLDLIYAGTPLKQASNYFEIVDGKLVESVAK